MSESRQVLSSVDKAEKYNKRIVELFDETEWNRDNFRRNYEEAWNTYRTVDELIEDLNTELGHKQNRLQQKIEDFGEERIEELERKNFEKDHYPTLIHYKSIGYREMGQIDQRIKEYKAYQEELMKGVAEKLLTVSKGYRQDFVGSHVYENTVEAAKDKIEDEAEKIEQRLENKIQRETSGLEAAMDAFRTELKFYRDYVENHGEASNDALGNISERMERLEELLENISGNGFEELPTDERGRVTLNSDAQERVEKEKEQERSMDAVNRIDADDTDQNSEEQVYEISGRPLEKQYNIIQEAVAEHDLIGCTNKEVATHFNVSRRGLFKKGGILDRIEEEYETRFGLG